LTLTFCPYCAVAKITKTPLKKTKVTLPKSNNKQKKYEQNRKHELRIKLTSTERNNLSMYNSNMPGETICVDLKHMPPSLNGEIYLCTFTCTTTRLSDPTPFKTRLGSEFLVSYKQYCKYIRNKTGRYPKYLICDNGKEFINTQTADYNKSKGISTSPTAPYSSLQNSIAERLNRTLAEGSLALLVCAGLPNLFWVYSILFINFVKCRTPHKSLNYSNPITSWNIFNNHRSNIDLYDIRTFGAEAWVLIETTLKNNPKAIRCIYLGPCTNAKGSFFYNIYSMKVIVSRNFIINEQCYPGRTLYPHIYDKYLGIKTTDNHLPIHSIDTLHSDKYNIPLCKFHCDTSSDVNTHVDDDNPNPTHKIDADSDMKEEELINITDDKIIMDVPTEHLSFFDRHTHSKVGPADMPVLQLLPTPAKNHSSSPSTTNFSPSPTLSTTNFSTLPNLEKSTPNAIKPKPSAVKTSSGDVEELYAFDAIIGKRKTKFGTTKGGKWKYGGNVWDYQVKWANGDITFEPETSLSTYASDAIADFEKGSIKPELAQNTEVQVAEASSKHAETKSDSESPQHKSEDTVPPKNTCSTSFTSFANFVFLPFFCFLTKFVPSRRDTSWKNIKVPNSDVEMLRSPERNKWLDARRKELDEIISKETWKKVKHPKKKPITCRWIYKLKPPTTLNPEPVFKARLVAHGYKQQANVDYSSTFAQVATLKAFRILMWLAVIFGFKATQMDVKNAFLAGKLDKEIYMTAPPGYEEEFGTVLLLKSLYGLKQAPRIWYKTLVDKLHSLGFKELINDSCVFSHHSVRCYILVFVDDIIVFTADEIFRSNVEKDLQATFDLKLLGALRYFIGLQIDVDDDGNVHIHQYDYIQKLKDVFKKFFTNTTTINTPYDPNVKFSKTQQPTTTTSKEIMQSYPYRQLIGSLLYLLGTRPELYFIIIILSKFVTNPGYIHWLAALRVLFYVCNTPLMGLIIRVGQKFSLSVYVDSDHGGNIDDRKSMSGYIIYLGSTPIVWRSRQQKGKPAESSCEAEYISLSSCINEVVWIISFLSELSFQVPTPIPIYCDNKSAKDLAYNPVQHERTKHIDIRYHRIREFILDGTITINYVKSADNPADIFTKTVSVSIFKRLLPYVYGKFSKFSTYGGELS
jgi:hypothetical protein